MEENPQKHKSELGMVPKYNVSRIDGKPMHPFFVLELDDPLAKKALATYIEAAQEAGCWKLAEELRNMLAQQLLNERLKSALDRPIDRDLFNG